MAGFLISASEVRLNSHGRLHSSLERVPGMTSSFVKDGCKVRHTVQMNHFQGNFMQLALLHGCHCRVHGLFL